MSRPRRLFRSTLHVLHEGLQVVVVTREDFFSGAPHLRHDGIILLLVIIVVHGNSMRSSGVRIRGATKPAFWHASSILGASCPLAKCRQFQVRRKVTP